MNSQLKSKIEIKSNENVVEKKWNDPTSIIHLLRIVNSNGSNRPRVEWTIRKMFSEIVAIWSVRESEVCKCVKNILFSILIVENISNNHNHYYDHLSVFCLLAYGFKRQKADSCFTYYASVDDIHNFLEII